MRDYQPFEEEKEEEDQSSVTDRDEENAWYDYSADPEVDWSSDYSLKDDEEDSFHDSDYDPGDD